MGKERDLKIIITKRIVKPTRFGRGKQRVPDDETYIPVAPESLGIGRGQHLTPEQLQKLLMDQVARGQINDRDEVASMLEEILRQRFI